MRIWGVDNYQWALVGSRYVERHLGSLVRAWGSPLCFPYPGPRTADTHWQSENWCSSPNTSRNNQPFNKYNRLDTQTSHQNTHEEWLIDKDVELSSKYSDLVKAITVCLVCSKQYPRPKEHDASHQSSQLVRDWQINYIGSFPLSEGFQICLDLCGHNVRLNINFLLLLCKLGFHH